MGETPTVFSNNIYVSSSPILHVSRIFGLAPFWITWSGTKRKMQQSTLILIYSVSVGVSLVLFALRGMMGELGLQEKSFRTKGRIAKYVTFADIIMVEVTTVLAIANNIVNQKKLRGFIKCLSEVDVVIDPTDFKKARAVSIRVLSVIVLGTTLLLSGDLYVWYAEAQESEGGVFVITNYLPYHLSYFVVVLAECQYAHMVHCVGRRLKSINASLRKIGGHQKAKPHQTAITKKFSKRNYCWLSGFGQEPTRLNNATKKTSLALPVNDHILRLAQSYLQLCDATEEINAISGHLALVVLVASLLHLTVTPYFFILELTGRHDGLFLALQSSWFLAHFFQLLLVVEPSHQCLEEVKAMTGLVCQLLVSDVSGGYKKQLELFFAQLQYRPIEFSAFGLGVIDRSLVTSMAGAVTIYLVTVIQFQNAAGS